MSMRMQRPPFRTLQGLTSRKNSLHSNQTDRGRAMSFLGDELIFDVINAFTPMDENAKWHKLCGIPNALVSGVAGTLLAMAFIGTGALLPFVLGAAAISAAVCVGMNLIGK